MTDITTILKESADFPPLLKEIASPPKELFVRGSIPLLSSSPLIAIVGTRRISEYGKQVIHHIVPPLVKAGAVIVSGLAFGVDAYAHKVALEEQGKCIAVFGCGIDQIYPQENTALARKILELGGALVSEYPVGTPSLPHQFPVRNRIISGLSKATIIIEAKEKSGSLITANFALEQNRDVYAVPGNIFHDNQKGTNSLISRGAIPVTSAEELLDKLNLKKDEAAPTLFLHFDSKEEETIFTCLQEPRSLDDLASATNLNPSLMSQTISLMELKGLVKTLGGRYTRVT